MEEVTNPSQKNQKKGKGGHNRVGFGLSRCRIGQRKGLRGEEKQLLGRGPPKAKRIKRPLQERKKSQGKRFNLKDRGEREERSKVGWKKRPPDR